MNRKSTFIFTSIKSILNSLSDLCVSNEPYVPYTHRIEQLILMMFIMNQRNKEVQSKHFYREMKISFLLLRKSRLIEAWNESVISMLKWHEGTGRDLTSNSAFFTPTLLWTFYHVSSSIWNRLKIPKFSRVFRIYVDNWIIGKILSTHHSLSKLYNHMMARISVTWKWAKHASQMGVKWGAIFCQQ